MSVSRDEGSDCRRVDWDDMKKVRNSWKNVANEAGDNNCAPTDGDERSNEPAVLLHDDGFTRKRDAKAEEKKAQTGISRQSLE